MRPLSVRIFRNLRNPGQLLGWASYQLFRDNNVHFVTLPSSGTHWLRFMLAKALVDAYDLDYEFTGIRPHDLVPTFRAKDQRFRYNDRESIPRIQHSHKGYSMLYRGSRVILLVRDLRDSMVSSYDTYSTYQDSGIDFSAFIRGHGVDERYHRTLERRVDFLNSWHNNRDKLDDQLIVRYEDLQRAPEDQVREVLHFAGFDTVTDELISDVVEFGSMENMRELENPEETGPPNASTNDDVDPSEGKKVNKGQSSRWQSYFSKDDLDYFKEFLDENLVDDYGYDYFAQEV